eukprot:scaffold11338_cov22-Phaeocystis_antarctica.AAC.1
MRDIGVRGAAGSCGGRCAPLLALHGARRERPGWLGACSPCATRIRSARAGRTSCRGTSPTSGRVAGRTSRPRPSSRVPQAGRELCWQWYSQYLLPGQ